VFDVPNARKAGDSLFQGAAAGRATGSVKSGALEGSGTDPARSMVEMIASYRAYEAGQKAIRTIDETLNKTVTQVASISG
jgi:flagellar basal-body rod protein FlgG